MLYKNYSVTSSDGEHSLCGRVYLPNGNAKGIFHIVHGMTEHIARYDRFMSDLANEGYIAIGYDNLGHGNTARNDGELGFIAHKDGYRLLAMDVGKFSDAVREEYGRDLPYYLFGHSMGSFIVRYATSEGFVSPNGLIVMGTAGANPAAGLGLMLISVIKFFCGEKHFSPLIDGIAFGSYNKRFGGGSKEDPKPWLTTDDSVRARYYNDKFCTFNFSVSAMGDLIRLIKLSNSKDWFASEKLNMPILLVSGEDDPVGNYGKGVIEVRDRLSDSGKKVECILYSGARHEILNEFVYDKVKEDIFGFLV